MKKQKLLRNALAFVCVLVLLFGFINMANAGYFNDGASDLRLSCYYRAYSDSNAKLYNYHRGATAGYYAQYYAYRAYVYAYSAYIDMYNAYVRGYSYRVYPNGYNAYYYTYNYQDVAYDAYYWNWHARYTSHGAFYDEAAIYTRAAVDWYRSAAYWAGRASILGYN